MTDNSVSDQEAFGRMHPINRDQFGLISGGSLGGGFGWIYDHVKEKKWERGIFGQSDREFLLETPTTELTTSSARSTRQRIRKRVLSTYFDARMLRYIDRRDRELIFQSARDAAYDLHFREGFKELIRFTYLGLLELETDIDIREIVETAVREAEHNHAVDRGENANFQVEIDVTRIECDSVEELERRYHQRDKLTRDELAVLVNSQHTNEKEDIEHAKDISLADALYYSARQPDSDPYGYSWQDPDREEAEQIVERLQAVFEDHDIETYDDLEVGIERIRLADEELADELRENLNRLSRVAPNFETQLTLGEDLPASDKTLLHDILYNPDNIDVETALERKTRPPTAGEEWDPAEDEYLQKFIARIQVVREGNSIFASGGEEGPERWNRVLELADFDEDEWGEYMETQRFKFCKRAVERFLEDNDDVDRAKLAELLEDAADPPYDILADSPEQLERQMGRYHGDGEVMKQFDALIVMLKSKVNSTQIESAGHNYGKETLLEAIRQIAEGGAASE